ncbi:serine hydrolase, partial [Jatrophihabitans endophyticus]|uniref:serine hydrolase domain-containing protein n=1 Tax=Jatrophihabitans endophyticus TaxID=1206085 RepID=UPI0019E82A4E
MGDLDSALAAVDDWPVPTAAAAVVGPDGVLATRGPVDHLFRLASVTKPLAALAVLVAVEEEALSLDDPADERLVPGATVRHLLAHASGLAPERPLRSFPPATRRVYSNVGIERAADLVAAATGMTFASYLDESLEPLGLTATTLPGSPARDGVSSVADLARVCHELLAPTGLLAASTLEDLRTVQWPGLR